jgi:hypothetical protein
MVRALENKAMRMPHLSKFADPSVMKALLSERLPLFYPDSVAITSCHVQHVRYSPKKKPENESLAACYHLRVRDKDSQHEQTVILYCKAFRGGRSQREIDTMAHHSTGSHTTPKKPIHFRDLDLLLWVFPEDPAIPHLPEVSDPKRVMAYLPYSSLPKGLDGPGDIRSVDVSGIDYHPGLRCTIRYDLHWGTADLPLRLTLFGKTYRSAEGHDVFARSEYLWNHCSGVVENVLFAQPLGYTSSVQTLWQLGIEGVPLRCAIGENNCDAYLKTVAKGLAMIHHSDLGDLPKWTLDEYLAEADKKIEKLCRATPTLVEELNLLAQRIHRDAPISSDIPLRPMYGEFHVEQLLAQDGKIAFLDFDEFALGDPLQDIANFIVDLHFREVSPMLAQRMAKSLYDSYRSLVKWEVPIDRVRWHARVQFINKAYRVYIKQPPDVKETVTGTIHMATQETTLDWLDHAIS